MKKVLAIAAIAATTFPFLVSAQVITSVSQVQTVATNIYTWLLWFFWLITAGFIIWAAMLYVTARGDEEKVKKAKTVLIYAIVAIVVAILATSIRPLITNVITPATSVPSTGPTTPQF